MFPGEQVVPSNMQSAHAKRTEGMLRVDKAAMTPLGQRPMVLTPSHRLLNVESCRNDP